MAATLSSTCALLALLLAAACSAQTLSRFTSCPSLTRFYTEEALQRVGPYGLTGGPRLAKRPSQPVANFAPAPEAAAAAPEAGVDFSETNVQVQGVDEPDIVKTDGRRVFVVRRSTFHVVNVLSSGAAGKETGTLKLPGPASEMLIQGDRVLVIARDFKFISFPSRPSQGRFGCGSGFSRQSTIVYQISVAGSKPKLLATLRMDGNYVSAREVSGIARIVMTFNPSNFIRFRCPVFRATTDTQATELNKDVIRGTTARDWLPRYELKTDSCIPRKGKGKRKGSCVREISGYVSSCAKVFRPTGTFSGFGLLTVATVPLSGLLKPRNSVSITSDGDTVYSTASTLYVATTDYQFDIFSNSLLSGPSFKTSLHKFALKKSGARYVASGQVSGSVLNQFSMHEHNGRFFVATTEGAPWWGSRDLSASKVTAFETRAPMQKLVKIGEVGNLGVGERIFAVRYIADTAYVVTFRQVDPLYIIDLSNPKKPRVTGELKIPGFSSYLHPIKPGRLLGVGREVTLDGRATGAKVTLFDVQDVTKPKELSTWTLEGSYTSAQWDHRAFLYWQPESVAVMPVSVSSTTDRFSGSIVLQVSDKKITERGRVMHAKCCGQTFSPGIERNLVLGKTHLWSLSSEKLQVNNIKDLSLESSVPLKVE